MHTDARRRRRINNVGRVIVLNTPRAIVEAGDAFHEDHDGGGVQVVRRVGESFRTTTRPRSEHG
jgi:hypothetical protein